MSNKEIKVSLKSKTQLLIMDSANPGDFIDVNNLDSHLDATKMESIWSTIKDKKIEEEIAKRANAEIDKEKKIFEANKKVEINKLITEQEKRFNLEIAELKAKISSFNSEKKNEIQSAITPLQNQVFKLQSDLDNSKKQFESDKQILVKQKDLDYKVLMQDLNKKIQDYQDEITDIKSQNKWKKFQNWDAFPDGGLENYCFNFYNNHIKKYWPHIIFIKDNKTIDGTKGDFILREERDDGFKFSISFEMKNEKENNIKGFKIKTHYAQANNNRNKKECKYSVIVTTLEPETEFNVREINDYPDMWIVRPEFFEDIITQLRDKEISIFNETLRLRNDLIALRRENMDFGQFEERIDNFKNKFGGHYVKAKEKFEKAIDDIDNTIKYLSKVKENLTASSTQLDRANNDLDLISIKKLTHGIPTVTKLLKKDHNHINDDEKKS